MLSMSVYLIFSSCFNPLNAKTIYIICSCIPVFQHDNQIYMSRVVCLLSIGYFIHSLAVPPTLSGLRIIHGHPCPTMASGHVALNLENDMDKFIHGCRS